MIRRSAQTVTTKGATSTKPVRKALRRDVKRELAMKRRSEAQMNPDATDFLVGGRLLLQEGLYAPIGLIERTESGRKAPPTIKPTETPARLSPRATASWRGPRRRASGVSWPAAGRRSPPDAA